MRDLMLAIESSCDDTCMCLMNIYTGEIVYNRSVHQDEIHSQYGGIVPNLASEEHLKHIQLLHDDLLKNNYLLRVKCVAVTMGPGLIGSLLVGVSFAKGIACALGVPLLRINHLEGHAMSCMIENKVRFPYLLLLVSGGNSQIVLAKTLGDYTIIGKTLDDAGGEALDKIAKNLEIAYPGGVNMEKQALQADIDTKNSKIRMFKNGCINGKTFNFSFSGLKTQVLRKIESLGGIKNIDEQTKSNIAYEAQEAVFDTLVKKTQQAILKHQETNSLIASKQLTQLIVCGGVSANQRLAFLMKYLADKYKLELVIPPLKWTTDNAGMIAKVACIQWLNWKAGKYNIKYNTMDMSFSPVARWDLEQLKDY